MILYDLFVGATWMSEHLHVSSALPGRLAQAGCSHGARANEAPGFFRFCGWGGQQINKFTKAMGIFTQKNRRITCVDSFF